MANIRRYVDNDNVVLGLVGNKSDLAHARAVSIEEASAFARDHNMSYVKENIRKLSSEDSRKLCLMWMVGFLKHQLASRRMLILHFLQLFRVCPMICT